MENKNKYPTLEQIRDSHGWKREYERFLILSRFIFRPIGFLFTWSAIRIGLTTEQVAWFSGIIGITGCAFLLSNQQNFILTGILLLLFFNILDCVDGSIARATKTENPYGRFLDSICGGAVDLAFWGVIGFMSFRNPNVLMWKDPFGYGTFFWLIMGSMTCFFYIYLSHVEILFSSTLRAQWDKLYKNAVRRTDRNNKTSFIKDPESKFRFFLRNINNNLRVRENHYLLLIITYFTHTVDILITFYFLYYLAHLIIILIIFSKRGKAVKYSN